MLSKVRFEVSSWGADGTQEHDFHDPAHDEIVQLVRLRLLEEKKGRLMGLANY